MEAVADLVEAGRAAAEGVADLVAVEVADPVAVADLVVAVEHMAVRGVRLPWAAVLRSPDLAKVRAPGPRGVRKALAVPVPRPALEPAGPTLQVLQPVLEPPTLRAGGPRARN